MATGMIGNRPRFNQFLQGHQQMAGKYNALTPEQQQAARQQYRQQGPAAFRGMLNTPPAGAVQDPAYTGLTGGTDPVSIVQDQGAMNKQAQADSVTANTVNTQGPYGDVTETVGPNGERIQTTTLSPGEQAIQNARQGQQADVYDAAGNRINQVQGQGAFAFGQDAATPWSSDYSADRQRVEDAVYKRFQSRYEPQFAQETENLKQELTNQGIAYSDDPNSQYQRRMTEMLQRQGDLRQDAMARATEMGGAEQQRLFEQSLAGRQQYTGEQLTERDRPLTEAERLAGLQQEEKAPAAVDPYQQPIQPADITTPGMQRAQIKYERKQARKERRFKRKQAALDRAAQLEIAAKNKEAQLEAARIAADAVKERNTPDVPPYPDEAKRLKTKRVR